MANEITLTILGCGPSGGVPLVGCECGTCTSPDPKNKRGRASVLVESGDTRILIDTSPDLRAQALRERFSSVDAILYTHAHADHCHGIDDARAFNFHNNMSLPVYGTKATLDEIKDRFKYAFHPPVKDYGWFRPSLQLHEIGDFDTFKVRNLEVKSFLQHHGKVNSSGYRFGSIAYSTDVNKLPEQSFQLLEKLDVWVVDSLQPQKHGTHAHLDQTLEWIEKVQPKLAILTHMTHALEYHVLKAQLPPHIIPAHDGLKVTLNGTSMAVSPH